MRTSAGDRIVLRVERTPDGIVISVGGAELDDGGPGPAASFIARLHGGCSRTSTLEDGQRVVQAFIPSPWTGPTAGSAEPSDAIVAADA